MFYDKLSDHAEGCSFLVKDDFAATYCADGFIALDSAAGLINPSTAFKSEAKRSYTLGSRQAPLDARLDTYLSLISDPGIRLLVYKKHTLENLNIILDQEGPESGTLVGGFFSPDHVIFHIEDQDKRFI